MADKGLLLVLSGPSGVGKGTVKSAIVENKVFPFEYSVSMTTRQPRPGEVNGQDYFFVSEDRFQEAIKNGELLEYNKYVGHYYGTPLAPVKKMLHDGKDVLLEIDVIVLFLVLIYLIECNKDNDVTRLILKIVSLLDRFVAWVESKQLGAVWMKIIGALWAFFIYLVPVYIGGQLAMAVVVALIYDVLTWATMQV